MSLDQFSGKFHLVSQENIDEYLKAIGVNPAMRAMAHAVKPHIECVVNGDELELHVHGGGSNHEMQVKMKLDQESEIKTPDGRHVKVMLHMDGNKLIQKEHWADKEATVIHEIKGDEWTANLTCGNARAVRHFKRE